MLHREASSFGRMVYMLGIPFPTMVGMYTSCYTPLCTSLGTPVGQGEPGHGTPQHAGTRLTALTHYVAERTFPYTPLTVSAVTDVGVTVRHRCAHW